MTAFANPRALRPFVAGLAWLAAGASVACAAPPQRPIVSEPATGAPSAAAALVSPALAPVVDVEARLVHALHDWARESFVVNWGTGAVRTEPSWVAQVTNASTATALCGTVGSGGGASAPLPIDSGKTRELHRRGRSADHDLPRGVYCVFPILATLLDPDEVRRVVPLQDDDLVVIARDDRAKIAGDGPVYFFAGSSGERSVSWDGGRVVRFGKRLRHP